MNKNIKPETRTPKLGTVFSGDRGTTLIEVLMASVIFMIGMLALLGMQITAMHSNKIGGEITEATSLVSDEIERLWGLDLASANDLKVGTHNDPNNPINNQGQAGGKYTRQWIVTGDASNTNSRFIQVTVSWSDFWSKSRKVTFTGMR
ncbi:MAG: prepilin-type N-terminal cleavage/methylation domain-containing protein [bacterium]|nr:prepilin-type N-terminal cleavage/methylation domain-containing protein [bacterium]